MLAKLTCSVLYGILLGRSMFLYAEKSKPANAIFIALNFATLWMIQSFAH